MHQKIIWSTKCATFFLLTTVVIGGSVYIGLTYNEAEKAVRRPHIVVIMADDLGWNDVGFHGSNQIPTPNIDALAYNGIILHRHYVLPTCTPSRTAFLTGRYPIRTGMQGYPMLAGERRGIPLNETLLPEYMKRLGYATYLIGKWHVGYYSRSHTPARRGFDSFFGYYSGYIQYFNHTITQENRTGYDLHRDESNDFTVEYNRDYMTDLITKEAESVISKHDKDKPLFLEVAHLAPHCSDAEDPMEVRDEAETNATLGYIKDVNRRKYAGLVAALDESVGRVIEALKRNDMLENSVILFIADNGGDTQGNRMVNYGSNYPLRGMKYSLFDGGIRGTACLYSPLIKNTSRVSDQLIHITDWLPTFYSLGGGNLGDLDVDLDGVDQWAAIEDPGRQKRNAVLFNIDEKLNEFAALIGRYKLVRGGSEFGKYYGDAGVSDAYPAYDISSVLSSATGSAIAGISAAELTSDRILQLRRDGKVSCRNFTSFSPCEDGCLFDVYEDPCETTDLSAEKPKTVDEIEKFIRYYASVLVNQTNREVDPMSFPEYFNGTWMPWIEDSRTDAQFANFQR